MTFKGLIDLITRRFNCAVMVYLPLLSLQMKAPQLFLNAIPYICQPKKMRVFFGSHNNPGEGTAVDTLYGF
jgi:hypothetical protein